MKKNKKLISLISTAIVSGIACPVILTSCSDNTVYRSEATAYTNELIVRCGSSGFLETLQFTAKFFNKSNQQITVNKQAWNYTPMNPMIANLSIKIENIGLFTVDATRVENAATCNIGIYVNPENVQLEHHKIFSLTIQLIKPTT